MLKTPLSTILARIALAFCYLGFGIWEIISPKAWTTYLPAFLKTMNPILLIEVHGIALTVAALGVLSGYFQKFFTAFSVLLLLDICVEIFFQEGFTDIFIRDVSLLLFACALFAGAFARKQA